MTDTIPPRVTGTRGRRVFISYKRSIDPDERVALNVYEALKELQYDVFIDRVMQVGSIWAERIEEELRRADYLIAFLSADSVRSEMVVAEVDTAHRLRKEGHNGPIILPVRLAYREPFEYPLSAYLNRINWASWQTHADTPRLIEDLSQAISQGGLPMSPEAPPDPLEITVPKLSPPLPSAQPIVLESPDDGTMDPQSTFYVERRADQVAMNAIQRQGVTITIKAPRQMGKSSLLRRIIDSANSMGKHVVFLDFQLFNRPALEDADIFFRQFCSWITVELGQEDQVGRYWNAPLGNGQRCTRYISHHLLNELNAPLLLALDEVEKIFDSSFRSDFFGMLRSWHNDRRAGSIWKNLDLALVTSTEPYQFIDNLNQSPFNVGEVLELPDLTPEQVSDLNRRHGAPLSSEQEKELMALVGGHPFLIRRALYLVASARVSARDLFARATEDHGPFGDHLRHHLFRLCQKRELLEGMNQIVRHGRCYDEQIFFRLHGAGLVSRNNQSVVPRYRLYADFFRGHLGG